LIADYVVHRGDDTASLRLASLGLGLELEDLSYQLPLLPYLSDPAANIIERSLSRLGLS
jgi:hypothetical protein